MDQDWREALDKGDIVLIVAIDLSMAFDTINHNLLLAKMKAYGLSQNALNVIQSMVKYRPHN